MPNTCQCKTKFKICFKVCRDATEWNTARVTHRGDENACGAGAEGGDRGGALRLREIAVQRDRRKAARLQLLCHRLGLLLVEHKDNQTR
jgi:hypothetical protein